MKNEQLYFENHNRAGKFPWSLYHRSLESSLISFLKKNESNSVKKILVIGPGAFFEEQIIKDLNYVVDVLDIDQRVLENLSGKKIENYILSVDGTLTKIASESYDLVYAKEVIEHIPDYIVYLSEVRRILRPEGRAWLSTPNYGFFLLPFLENIFLELIAKLNGYSRKGIHPSKFSVNKFESALSEVSFSQIEVRESEFKLAIVACVKK